MSPIASCRQLESVSPLVMATQLTAKEASETLQPNLVALCVIMLTLSTLALSLRMWSNYINPAHNWWWDDFFAVITLVSSERTRPCERETCAHLYYSHSSLQKPASSSGGSNSVLVNMRQPHPRTIWPRGPKSFSLPPFSMTATSHFPSFRHSSSIVAFSNAPTYGLPRRYGLLVS